VWTVYQREITVRSVPKREDGDSVRSYETARRSASDYLKRGWKPIPIATGRKSPNDLGWQHEEITADNLRQKFQPWHGNVGVQFGKVSGGLTDFDLDCRETLLLADHFLPETGAVFGRRSKRRSHRLYVTDLADDEPRAVIRFSEPSALAHNPDKPVTLVELRIGGGDKGAQTIFPGSTHPSGEAIKWDVDGQPKRVSGADQEICERARRRGAACLALSARGNASCCGPGPWWSIGARS
jgi:hypothetical protein